MYLDLLKYIFKGLPTVKIRRSALEPFIRVMLYFSLPCLGLLIFAPENLQIPFLYLAAIPVALFSVISIYCMFFDRARFHTEEFLERKHQLEISESKREGLLIESDELINVIDTEPNKKALSDDVKEDPNG